MNRREFRSGVLLEYNASLSVAAELLAYNESPFAHSQLAAPLSFPLPPEVHIDEWRQYVDEAQDGSAFDTLRRRLVQMCFPIREGISQTDAYWAATHRGRWPDETDEFAGLRLKHPEALQLRIHESLGRLRYPNADR